jgi:GH25 family lysozyme M1 (1,4-beta-N-acetylmuramidase)
MVRQFQPLVRLASALLAVSFGLALASGAGAADSFNQPWKIATNAIVLDAYEHNALDWQALISDKRVTAFIGKASDGTGEPWVCRDPEIAADFCRLKFQRYFVAQELYQTRRALAKALGLKWGSYHLARSGDPIAQADHYLDFAKPTDDEVIVLDIEGLDEKWMSLPDAERFARRIHEKTGRYPMLYVNGSTARHIADNRADLRLLSRLPLWYARFGDSIAGHFPKGNWDAYALWQFSATPNCNKRRCPYRVPGTPHDIDVNVAAMTPDALRKAWPFNGLVPEKPLPVQPLPSGPELLVAAVPDAELPAQMAGQELVPLPMPAPRQTDAKPQVEFVAMANLAEKRSLAAGHQTASQLMAWLYQLYGAGQSMALVSPAMAEELNAGVDAFSTGSISTAVDGTGRAVGTTTMAPMPDALRAELPSRMPGQSGAF